MATWLDASAGFAERLAGMREGPARCTVVQRSLPGKSQKIDQGKCKAAGFKK
jgi:hypothetical protein